MAVTELDLLPRLADVAAGHAREASPDDAVDGVPSRWVVTPQDIGQVSAVMSVAHENRLAVVPRGAATKLRWGAPPDRLDVVLDMTEVDQLVEHAAGDLIAVVEAGRRLDTLQNDLGSAGQRLAVDLARSGTVGGLVATASTGPGRLHYGPVRDLVIGTTMVRADGVIARAGGKVVKNVAGYDLGKLLTGSFGTVGVIVSVAFRLHPIPETSRWVCVEVRSSSEAVELSQRVVHSHLVPTAAELDLLAGGLGTLAVRLDGIAPGVAARSGEAVELLGTGAEILEDAPAWWGSEPGDGASVLLKVSYEVAALAGVLDTAAEAAAESAASVSVRGSVAVGTLLVAVDGDAQAAIAVVERLRAAAPSFGGAVIILEAPREIKSAVDVWGPVRGLELMRRVKDQFDPEQLLSPGRFVGGI